MNPYGVDIRDENTGGPLVSLRILYETLPKTFGCEKCSSINGKEEKDWCCLSKGVLVYTNLGPIPIEEINPGSMVFTKSGLRKVKKTGRKKVKDNLIRFETRYGRQMLLTGDHKVLAGFGRYRPDIKQPVSNARFVQSKDLIEKIRGQHGHYVVFPKINLSEDNPSVYLLIDEYVENIFTKDQVCFVSRHRRGKSLSNKLKVDSDFLFILGLFLAEGSTSDATVDFHLSCGENHLVDKIVKFADRYGLDCSHKKNRGDSYTHRICSTVMSRLFSKLCGKLCDNKTINRKLFGLILPFKSLLTAIHDGYYAGGGIKGNYYSYSTTSRFLHDQMLFINLALGRICCSVHSSPENKKEYWTGSYSIAPKYRDYIEKENHYLVPVRKVNYEHYEGYVYDIEIENEESFYTEAGDVHNCKRQTPSMFYVEFLKVYKTVAKTWNDAKRKDLIFRAIRNYLKNDINKGCIFYNDGCTCYENRPLVCRSYGITPEETWNRRWEALKKREGENFSALSQCDLVSTASPITDADEEKWFEHTKKCESRIGVPLSCIKAHDGESGSYRTFHDHLLMELFDNKVLNVLTKFKISNPTDEEIDDVIGVIADLLKEV